MVGFLFNVSLTQGEINVPYYDNCGIFDDNPDNDCIQDCFGVWGGNAIFDECGICGGNGPKINMDCSGNCLIEEDCFGICGGKAKLDDCGKCDEDETNDCLKAYFDKCGNFDNDPLNDCVEDCAGIWGGAVKLDGCGICGGDNSTCADCAGVPYGNAYYDNCDVCDNNIENDCIQDCKGVWGGNLVVDDCGICGGDNSTCADCAGVPYGNAYYDNCGICDDDDSNDCVQDCSGEWGGDLVVDECGICGGVGILPEYCNCEEDVFDCAGQCGGSTTDCNIDEDEFIDTVSIDVVQSNKLDQSIYINRTISYYNFFPNMINPFYEEVENLPLVSSYRPKIYHGLNATKELKKIKKKTILGYDGKTFITSYKYEDNDILIPSVATVDYYKSQKIKNNNYNQIRQSSISHFKQSNKKNGKSKKLTLINRDLGFTNVAINLSGQIEIKGELEFLDSEGSTLSNQDNESWNLDIEQKQKFDLEGKVGDRLTVSANQNSDSSFDFENSLLLEYKGYDNEIINSIQAGNIGVSLSEGSLFSVGMGKRAGMFGVKMLSKLGPLEINTIIGREKVQKESGSLGQQSDGLDRYDYSFKKDKYFFIDKIFKGNFYPLNQDKIHTADPQYVIDEFRLYKRAQTNEIQTDMYEGIAFIDPLNTDIGTPEENIWIELEDHHFGNDYYIDKHLGYVRLNSLSSSDLIAVHYTIGEYVNGQIVESSDPFNTGTEYNVQDRCLLDNDLCDENTLFGCSSEEASSLSVCDEENSDNCCSYIELNDNPGFSAAPLLLKIIKTEGQQQPPSPDNPNGNPTWELMMKNIYDIGLSNFNPGTDVVPEIEIVHIGGQLGTETSSPNGNTFLRIFGMDSFDSQGNISTSGDGKIDSRFINPWGELMIPFDMPFAYDSEGVLGNSHEDLSDIFDGELENLNTEVILRTRKISGDIVEFTTYTYQNGPAMYYSSNETTKASEKEFVVRVKNINQNTTINLGFMIIEGSETLTYGSQTLIKGVDYSIDYFTGTLTLISDKAKNNYDSIRISYDRNEIVSFDQKLIIGNSFKYKFFNESSLFGGAYFYKQSIPDNKVEIGYEPMENFIWHLGGKYSKDLLNLNNLVNNNSNLNLTKSSKVTFASEFAQIFPNPNPIGIAYIDDFESSKRYSTLPISHASWKISSPPFIHSNEQCLENENEMDCEAMNGCEVVYNSLYEFQSCKSEELIKYNTFSREKIYWYNPWNDIPTEYIWPERDVGDYSKEKTLWIEIPEEKTGGNYNNENYANWVGNECYDSDNNLLSFISNEDDCSNYSKRWWNGITTSLYASDQNQSNNKYLDMWINTDGLIGGESHYLGSPENPVLVNRNNLKLHIDIGVISEDTNDNGSLDTEDLKSDAIGYGDGLLDIGEDVGIDSCIDDYEDGWGGCLCFNFDHGDNNNNAYNRCISGAIDSGQVIDGNTVYSTYMMIKNSGVNSDDIINLNILDESDPNGDNFSYSNGSTDFSNYNGKEGNGSLVENKYPDSEDLNRDQFIDNINSYFTYTVELDQINSDIVESELETNWKLYRIPLNEFKAVNETSGYNADWTTVKNVRLWIEGIYDNNNTYGLIGIASMEIVGNEWEELGIVDNSNLGQAGYLESDYTPNENISIQLINNQDNTDVYDSPPGVSGHNQNSGGGIPGNEFFIDKEQSLVLDFNDTGSSSSGISSNQSAFIKKSVNYSTELDNEKQNSFFIYKNMEMFFNGQESNNGNNWFDCGSIENEECSNVDLTFRFGKDDDYYEIVKSFEDNRILDVKDPNRWQNMKIDLDELTRFKLNRENLESYQDNGIDGCIDLYETGNIDNGLDSDLCLNEDLILAGITTEKICNQDFELTHEEYCNELNNYCLEFINQEICNSDIWDNFNNYQSNIDDPNGDNFYEPGIECCELNDVECNPDLDLSSEYPSFNCPDEINGEHINTEGNNQYDCVNLNGEYCSTDDEIIFSETVVDDWDSDNLYTPNAFYDDLDQVWIWEDFCENNLFDNEEDCGQQNWNSIDLTSVCEDCDALRVKGEPAINKIEYIMVGVTNNSDGNIYGSVWINELRMTEVKKETGTAFTSSLTFNLGEIFDVDLSYKQEEANFHRLEQRLGSGDHSVNYSVHVGFSPHELFSENYFQMPITLKYSTGTYSPLYKPGSDIILGSIDSTPDYLKKKNDSVTLSTSIKTMLSDYYKDNLFYEYLLDNTKVSYTYKWDQTSNTTILNKENVYKKMTFDYNLKFDKDNIWSPFENIFSGESWKYDEDSSLIKFLKELNFYYTPQDISFNANIVNQDNYSINRLLYGGTVIDEENLDLHRNFQTNIKLHDTFSFRYIVDMKNNLNDYLMNNRSLQISEFFDLSFSPGLKKSYKEQFSFTYTPAFLDWLGPRFTYVPNYNWTRDAITGDNPTADISSDNKFTASFTFSFQQFVEQFYEAEQKSNSRSRSSRNRRSSSSRNKSSSTSDKLFVIDQPHFKTVLKFLHDIGQRFSSININYSYNRQNVFNNISSEINPDYSFKLGFSDIPSNDILNNSYEGVIVSTSNVFNQELKFNTSVQLTNNLTLSNMEYRISLSANQQSDSGYNETYSQSFFPLGSSGKSGVPIFGWSVNLRGLEKYSLINRWFKTFSVSHTYHGEKNEISKEYVIQKVDFKRNFTPLIRFDMTTKNTPLDIDLTFNNTLNIINGQEGDIERQTTDQVSLTFRYRQKTGFRVPVFFLRDFQVENEIDLSLKLGYDNSETLFSEFDQSVDKFEVIAFSKSYNLQPKITYNFSKFVEGDLWFNYIVNDNHTSGRKKETDIGFQVRVYFESFD